MTTSWQIAGHKKQIEFLDNSIKTGKLSHAYLFAGPAQVGKRTVAKKFVQSLLCESNSNCNECGQCKTFIVQSNADFIEVGTTEDIKIEAVRDLSYKLSLKNYSAKYKVAVIDNAENMTVEAANGLLKLLEEPKPNTIIVLIATNPFRLLRTITSRVQKINFGLVAAEEYEQFLPARISAGQKDMIKAVAAGKPGLAIQIASSEEYLNKLTQVQEQFGIFMGTDVVERLKMVSDVADLETPQIKELLDTWIANLEKRFVAEPNQNSSNRLKKTMTARRYLDMNVNSKLVLSDLMLSV